MLMPKLTPAWGVIVMMTVIVAVILMAATQTSERDHKAAPIINQT